MDRAEDLRSVWRLVCEECDRIAGVDLFTLSRRMGTSLAMIDATYGHLAPDTDERERVLLDAYDLRDAQYG